MHIKFSTSDSFFRWKPAALLRVTGEDAATFLQGQFTNDLRGLTQADRSAVYGLWLTLKGKVQADSFVLRGAAATEFWICSYFSDTAVIRERLESHVIADDVTISDETAGWEGISALGASAVRVAEQAALAGALVFPGRRDRRSTFELLQRQGAGNDAGGAGGDGPWLAAEEMERLRIGAGIPAIPIDLGPEDLPNEAGLEVEAISFTKGCYLGQEVMARLKSMGQVRRRLVRVQGAGPVPRGLPATLYAGGRAVGQLRSAVGTGSGGWMGLAMVSRMQVTAESQLSLEGRAGAGVSLLDTP